VIRAASMGDAKSYTYTDQNGNFTGFDVELFRDVARRMGVKAEFTGQDFSAILPAVNNGTPGQLHRQATADRSPDHCRGERARRTRRARRSDPRQHRTTAGRPRPHRTTQEQGMTTTTMTAPTRTQFHGSSLEVRDLHMAFGQLEVLRGVSVKVGAGEITCVIGPSGSGKSTLLRCLNRLEEPTAGDVLLAGESIMAAHPDRLRQRIGLVFQHFNLFPNHTALGNVTLALRKVKGMSREEAERIGRERLTEVGLADRMDHRPSHLSGGQQQRVAIARALAVEPEVMLFDEVTSALDPELVKGVLNLMADLGRRGMTMVVVTHEMGFARRVAGHVVFMDEGLVVEDGTPDQIFDNPGSPRLQRFLSEVL
jgi:ABC-type polar amino acid transport system ATPase subunit